MNRYAKFIFYLGGFLKHTLKIEESIWAIKSRIAKREENFLRIFKDYIYNYPKSPYLKLLNPAKINYKDIESFVKRDGLEGALHILRNEGVYLTLDEVKGRKNVIRKSSVFRFKESDFNNPFISPAFYIRSGGTMSGGTGVKANISFAFLEHRAQHRQLMFDMYELFKDPLIVWYPTLGGVEMGILLECAKIGKPPLFFFYQIDKKLRKPPLIAEMAFAYLRYMGRKSGLKLPIPELIITTESSKIIECINRIMENYPSCSIRTFVSSAVRICATAKKNRLDGVKFWISGEPLTNKRLEEISSNGASIICQYSFGETGGAVSIGCANPIAADDTHLFKDLFAVIQHRRKLDYADVTFDAFLFTALHSEAPKILLNVENGDYGIIEKRKCGCRLDDLGLDTHIYNIRSFEKFNAEGMTIFGCDLLKLIEDTLVPKYGGSSVDYQFLEEQDNDRTRTTLIVSPDVGRIDEKDMLDTIYKELSISPAYQTQLSIWRQADTLRIKRTQPIPNKRGKIYPIRVESNV